MTDEQTDRAAIVRAIAAQEVELGRLDAEQAAAKARLGALRAYLPAGAHRDSSHLLL